MIPKIKVFAWKLAKEALPVREVLRRRGMQLDPSCPMCDLPESCEHLIFGCSWTKHVWNEMLGLSDAQHGCNSILQWMMHCSKDDMLPRQVTAARWAITLATCWEIWRARCNWVFQQRRPYPGKVVSKARKMLEDWKAAKLEKETHIRRAQQSIQSEDRPMQQPANWVRPSTGVIKISCDAAWSRD